MIFLIEYDRTEGQIFSLSTFDKSELQRAQDTKLELELDLHGRGIEHEIVMLEAPSEAAIRMTHARYFEGLEQLVTKLKAQWGNCLVLTSGH
jgi:hypothetical protein